MAVMAPLYSTGGSRKPVRPCCDKGCADLRIDRLFANCDEPRPRSVDGISLALGLGRRAPRGGIAAGAKLRLRKDCKSTALDLAQKVSGHHVVKRIQRHDSEVFER
jgi:hypothetical protein